MTLRLYGLKSCDSCRKARGLLRELGVPHSFVDLRADPPAPARVAGWVRSLGSKPLKNTSGGSYRSLGPEKKQWDDDRWAAAMAADPMLIKRPVVELDDVARMTGFRPDALRELAATLD